ncbi:hypothetical protein HPB50_016373 [Hyalomma asiaticum]|uniref:Uncharacterized protein n=1 Tax=Hyalomma asiaticum TaxID=266040 RepID=A0ACB7RU94_HYAAI|nr:hypothetical protein HPB50_016373 [Hyalomma asiaticum]
MEAMSSLRGVIIGDSQMKFLCHSRLRLAASVRTCTFSFAGFDATCLASAVSAIRLQHVDFCVLYVGGNDLANSDKDPQDICDSIKELVLQLHRDVARVVYVFKVLPRCYDTMDTDVGRKTHKQRLLNRKLTATLKRLSYVRILNAELEKKNRAKKRTKPEEHGKNLRWSASSEETGRSTIERKSSCRHSHCGPGASTWASYGGLFNDNGASLPSGSYQGAVAKCGTLAEATKVLRMGHAVVPWAVVLMG